MQSPNIWIIQNDIFKLQKAFSNIKKDSTNNFLYTNCISRFNIDGVSINSKSFNTMLYLEDSNNLLIFMEKGLFSTEDVRNYLNLNQVMFNEINLSNEKSNIKKPYTLYIKHKASELWVVNDLYELDSPLNDTLIRKSKNKAVFYPLIDGNLSLNYLNNRDEEVPIDNIEFNGIITTIDKLILLSKSSKCLSNIKNSIEIVLKQLGYDYNVFYDCRPRFINLEEQKNKKYELKKKDIII